MLYLAGLLALLTVVAVSFYVGAMAQRNGRLAGMGQLLARPLEAVYNFGAARLGPTVSPEQIFIDLKFKHFNKLLIKREQALQLGFLVREQDDFVPAEIRTDSGTLPVKLRLKGDLLDHLRHERWSFRIHVKKGAQFRGMRRFSIQHPRTRGFVWEWAVLEAMRREEILAPRYGFLEVTFNGKPWGLYAFEESFGKELLESQARRESVIVKFNESWRWEEMATSEGRTQRFMQLNNAMIHVFNEQEVRGNPVLVKHYQAAAAHIEGFRRGEIPACDAFDCERVARFWAVADLMGASHALHWINLRYYYNPITTRLEPIAFDCLGGSRIAHLAGTGRLDLAEQRGHDDPNLAFMADPRFARLYVEALQRVSREEYLLELQEGISEDLDRQLRVLQREWPWEGFDWGVLESNQKLIRAYLEPPAALVARYDPASLETDRLSLRVANLIAFPVEVLGARVGSRELRFEPLTLEGKPARGVLDWVDRSLTLPPGLGAGAPEAVLPEVVVWHRLLGTAAIRESRAELGAPEISLRGAPRPAAGSAAFAEQHPFLEIDRENETVRVRPGEWSVAGDLVIPGGWTLTAGPGTRLEFEEGAVLLSYSPVELIGRADEPVILEPRETSWGGLQVIEARGPSRLEQVSIRGTAGVDRQGWTLTGGVTFYESPVTLVGTSFTEAHGEDALNIVRSSFSVTNCVFLDAAFDAMDIDFGQGSVVGTRFFGPGNDALDVSGSKIFVENLVIEEAGDKGISAGEASEVDVRGARIERSTIGIAAKDRSRVSVTDAEISDCEIGIVVFQKKPEFGGAFAYLDGSRLERNDTDYLVEIGSILQIDGERIQADARGVGDALYNR